MTDENKTQLSQEEFNQQAHELSQKIGDFVFEQKVSSAVALFALATVLGCGIGGQAKSLEGAIEVCKAMADRVSECGAVAYQQEHGLSDQDMVTAVFGYHLKQAFGEGQPADVDDWKPASAEEIATNRNLN